MKTQNGLLALIAAIGLGGTAFAQQPPDPNPSSDGDFNTAYGNGALLHVQSGQSESVLRNPSEPVSNETHVPEAYDAGVFNTAVGYNAMNATTFGQYNTGVGYLALFQNQTGNQNTASGAGALYANTTGNYNTAVGQNALEQNTTASDNTAAGYSALSANTTGYANMAAGYGALYSNTTGYYNTASGYFALHSNTDGFYNTATGFQALYSNTTGQRNFGDGVNALYSNTSGGYNTGFGVSALYSNTTGSYNIAEGYHGGYNLTTGSYNIDIGNAGVAAESGVIRIGSAGNQTAAYVAGIQSSQVTGAAVYVTASGQLGVLASSERYKTSISPMGSSTAKLDALRPVSFHLKTDPAGMVQYGLIAEEVNKVYPELVIRDAAGKIQGVRYDELAPMLLNEMQQTRRQAKLQNEKIRQLEQQVTEIGNLKRELAEMRVVMMRLQGPVPALAQR